MHGHPRFSADVTECPVGISAESAWIKCERSLEKKKKDADEKCVRKSVFTQPRICP